jgi:Fur family peroxide stress response transcriptional regulator
LNYPEGIPAKLLLHQEGDLMPHANSDLAAKLINKNIKPSYQRIRIFRYLIENQNHPTVDQIFSALQKELLTLSKTTVYNTLDLFVDKKLVRPLTIEENELRFDINVEDHGHFKCESCGQLFDFHIKLDDYIPQELNKFVINDKNIYFNGICPDCLKIKN